jgi:hypothetical protein
MMCWAILSHLPPALERGQAGVRKYAAASRVSQDVEEALDDGVDRRR